MATIHVHPRPTPAERHDEDLEIQVDDHLRDFADRMEDWTATRQAWEFTVHQGHEFGRSNNVEGRLLFTEREQTSSLSFRLDQLDEVSDTGDELVLRFEEQDGIAKLAIATLHGLEVQFFHILTFT